MSNDKVIVKQAFDVPEDSEIEEVTEEEALEGNFVSIITIDNHFQTMIGRVLTIVDAVIQEPRQNKAVKDLMKHEIIDTLDTLYALMEKK